MRNDRYQAYGGRIFRVEKNATGHYTAVGRAPGMAPYVLDRIGSGKDEDSMQRALDAWAKRNNIQPIKQQMCKQQGAVICKTQH